VEKVKVDPFPRITYSDATPQAIVLLEEEAAMAHGRDKQGREKRKPKAAKNAASKTSRGSEVLEHVVQHPKENPES